MTPSLCGAIYPVIWIGVGYGANLRIAFLSDFMTLAIA